MASVSETSPKIGLALSGGGIRAAAFHAGVLLYLAETKKLELVTHISTVSGGTLLAGLIYHHSKYTWPSSLLYENFIYPQIREILSSHCMQTDLIKKALKPSNWRLFFSRATILAQCIKELWGVDGMLAEIQPYPQWSINATTCETGKRFRFKHMDIGDYSLGYASEDFPLRNAMAVSAGFPVGIGPMKIYTKEYIWKKSGYNATSLEKNMMPQHEVIHLYDGGLYDNLGIEPLYDMGAQRFKEKAGVNRIIVSDAGAPYQQTPIPKVYSPRRFKRLFDIVMEQNRSLRVRSIVNFLLKNPSTGFYLRIGMHAADLAAKCEKAGKRQIICIDEYLRKDEIQKAVSYKTTLLKMREEDFDLISKHGYETMKCLEALYG